MPPGLALRRDGGMGPRGQDKEGGKPVLPTPGQLIGHAVSGFSDSGAERRFHRWRNQVAEENELLSLAMNAVLVFFISLQTARGVGEEGPNAIGKGLEWAILVVGPLLMLGPLALRRVLSYDAYLQHREPLLMAIRLAFTALAHALAPRLFCSSGCLRAADHLGGAVWCAFMSVGHRVRVPLHIALQVLWVACRACCRTSGTAGGVAISESGLGAAVDGRSLALYLLWDLLGTTVVVAVLDAHDRGHFLASEARAAVRRRARGGGGGDTPRSPAAQQLTPRSHLYAAGLIGSGWPVSMPQRTPLSSLPGTPVFGVGRGEGPFGAGGAALRAALGDVHAELSASPLRPRASGGEGFVGVKAAVFGWMEELKRYNHGRVRCTSRSLVSIKFHDVHLGDQSQETITGVAREAWKWGAAGGARGCGPMARKLIAAQTYVGPGCVEMVAQLLHLHHWQQWQQWQQWQATQDGLSALPAGASDEENRRHCTDVVAAYARWEAGAVAEQQAQARACAHAATDGAFLSDLMDAMPFAWMTGSVSLLKGSSFFRFENGKPIGHEVLERVPSISSVSPVCLPAGEAPAEVLVEWDRRDGDEVLCLRDGARVALTSCHLAPGGARVALDPSSISTPGSLTFLVRAPCGPAPSPGSSPAMVSSPPAPVLVLSDWAMCTEVLALGVPLEGPPGGDPFPASSSGAGNSSGGSTDGVGGGGSAPGAAKRARGYWRQEPFLVSCGLMLSQQTPANMKMDPAEVEEWERFSGSLVELACQHGLERLSCLLLRRLCDGGCRPPVTLLHTAVWMESETLVRMLLEDFVVPVNVCAAACGGITPLHVAVLLESTLMLDVLTRDHVGVACAARAADARGLTACDYAKRAEAGEHLAMIMRKASEGHRWGDDADDGDDASGGGSASGCMHDAEPEASGVGGEMCSDTDTDDSRLNRTTFMWGVSPVRTGAAGGGPVGGSMSSHRSENDGAPARPPRSSDRQSEEDVASSLGADGSICGRSDDLDSSLEWPAHHLFPGPVRGGRRASDGDDVLRQPVGGGGGSWSREQRSRHTHLSRASAESMHTHGGQQQLARPSSESLDGGGVQHVRIQHVPTRKGSASMEYEPVFEGETGLRGYAPVEYAQGQGAVAEAALAAAAAAVVANAAAAAAGEEEAPDSTSPRDDGCDGQKGVHAFGSPPSATAHNAGRRRGACDECDAPPLKRRAAVDVAAAPIPGPPSSSGSDSDASGGERVEMPAAMSIEVPARHHRGSPRV